MEKLQKIEIRIQTSPYRTRKLDQFNIWSSFLLSIYELGSSRLRPCKPFFPLDLTKFFRRHIVTFFVNHFNSFDVVTNGATITFNIFFTKFCLFHCFFWRQTFCFFFFLASSLIRAIFFRCHKKTYFLPAIRLLFCVQLIKGGNSIGL